MNDKITNSVLGISIRAPDTVGALDPTVMVMFVQLSFLMSVI